MFSQLHGPKGKKQYKVEKLCCGPHSAIDMLCDSKQVAFNVLVPHFPSICQLGGKDTH